MHRLIIIDPGHGGHKPGAVYDDIKECDIALAAAQRFWLIADKEYRVILTRASDMHIGLNSRARIANQFAQLWHPGQSIFISFHYNAWKSSQPRGHAMFFQQGDITSKLLATAIHNEIIDVIDKMPVYNEGIIDDTFKYADGLTVLRKTEMPAAYSEFGFLSNDIDRELMCDPLITDRFVNAVMRGIKIFFKS